MADNTPAASAQSPTCPNGHPWASTMRVCPVCRSVNSAFRPDTVLGAGPPVLRIPARPAPPVAGGAAPVPGPVSARAPAPAPAPAAAAARPTGAATPPGTNPAYTQDLHEKISSEANLEALRAALAKFRQDHGDNSRIIGVFGSPDSGKSFLNARLHWLVGANRAGTTGKHGFRVVRATPRNTATWADFDLSGPTGTSRKILVVDLPGEEFLLSTGSGRQVVAQYEAVLKVADALILYIAADVIDNPSKFEGSARSAGVPVQDHYLQFLQLAADSRPAQGQRTGFTDLPLFVALSRADRVFGTQLAGQGVDPWRYLFTKAPLLASGCAKRYTTFSCGFVASHVGAEACVAVGFLDKNRKRLENLVGPIRAALRGTPLEGYFLACLTSQLAESNGEVERLPTLEELQACGVSEEEFALASALMARGDRQAVETQARVQSIVDLTLEPIADDQLPSFGVRSMMDRMIDLIDEPANGIHRGRPFEYAAVSIPDVDAAPRRKMESAAAAWLARRLPRPRGFGDRLLRRLKLTTNTHIVTARLIAATTALMVAVALVYLWRAVPAVHDRQQATLQTIRGTTGLPEGFALDAAEVWRFDAARLDAIRKDFAARLPRLSLRDDHLVRSPDFALAMRVNEPNQPLHVLLPAPPHPNWRAARALLDGIECPDGRQCRTAGQPIVPPDPGVDGARVLNYVSALDTYIRGGSSAEVQKFLRNFDKSRRDNWGVDPQSATSPTKQILLPTLLVDLLKAHTAFRDEMNGGAAAGDGGRNAHRRYGNELSNALGRYIQASSALNTPGKSRAAGDMNAELRAIGVEPSVLAAHLLATALAGTDTYDEFQKEVARRLGMLTKEPTSSGVFDLDAYSERYPTLLCLHHQMLRLGQGAATAGGGYVRACEASDAVAGNPFATERQLVDPRFWSGDRQRANIVLGPWVSLIRATAEKASRDERNPVALRALNDLRQLPAEQAAWRVMLEPRFAIDAAVLALVFVLVSWLLLRFWLLVLASHRLVAPYLRDTRQL